MPAGAEEPQSRQPSSRLKDSAHPVQAARENVMHTTASTCHTVQQKQLLHGPTAGSNTVCCWRAIAQPNCSCCLCFLHYQDGGTVQPNSTGLHSCCCCGTQLLLCIHTPVQQANRTSCVTFW
jgi:hypothetical protein